MSIFTNKSTVELIPQNEINSDFGVLLSRSASFNNFDKSKYQNADGTPNELAVKKIYDCLIHKHRSVFFESRMKVTLTNKQIGILGISKNDLQGIEGKIENSEYAKTIIYNFSITIFIALKWLYYKPSFLTKSALNIIEKTVQEQYPACYKALQMLPKEDVTQEEKDLLEEQGVVLEEQRTKFISFKAKLPIFVARQFYRHRGINFTERSGRYTAENTMFYKPDNWRKAPKKATQGSIENEFVEEKKLFGFLNYKILTWLMQQWFFKNISNKNSKELCRIGLPQSQMTTTINTVDLYTLSSVLSQRLDKHAQLEIREFAQKLYDIACQEFGKELIDKLIDIQNKLVF